MSFFSPAPPPFELEEWKRQPHLTRLKPLVQDWGQNGFGSPTAVYLLYAFKLVVYALGALLAISTTPGLGGLGDFGDWWTQPIVFEKFAVWTLLWEILGLGAGSMPLSFRFIPPIGGPLYWLRPGTVRLPPWPGRVPFTRGTRRTWLDVGLYAAVLATGLYLLFAAGVDASGSSAGRIAPAGIAALLGFLALLGLRDKVSFLGARPEIYATMLAVGLFPVDQWIVAWQFIFVFIWWGAASSKLNRHFPFVVSAMISNAPLVGPKALKRKLWRDYPEDMRPSRLSAGLAHFGTVQEFGWPLLLLTVDNDIVRTIAIVGMILFHLNITSMFPLAVPLEWNIFMIFGTLFLFGHYGDVPLSSLDDPLLIATIAIVCVGLPVLGNLRPDKVSFLPSMRYYAGNWPTTQWLFRKGSGAEEKLDTHIKKSARLVSEQVTRLYEDPELTDFLLNKGLSFRAMHSHGRALNGLLPHAVADVEAYDLREGELISNVVNGWNFGDGHFHGRQLLEAVQERCDYAPGEVRVIELEAEAVGSGRQHYRIYDAATGLLEEGSIAVADMVERQPWLEESWDFPVEVTRRREPAEAERSALVSEATVVGSGPNGLACAVALARAGVRVTVLEAAETIGGGIRSGELTVPGLIHDVCSAVHPMAAASPFLRSLGLERHGLEWRWPEVDLAHPLDDGSAATMVRSLQETAAGLGPDGRSWQRLFESPAAHFDALNEDALRPILHLPKHPVRLARFGLPAAAPATLLARRWRTPGARALFGGVAAHAFSPLTRPMSASVGMALVAACHSGGWPVAAGGTQSIANALTADLREHGGEVKTGVRVRSLAELGSPDIVVFDLAPGAVADIVGDRLPTRVARAYRRYKHGPGAFKVDLAVTGGVPWTAAACRRAGTVHAIGSFEELVAAERDVNRGRMPARPFVLVGQQYLADPERSAGDVHPVWAYAHVPSGYNGDAEGAVIDQIERFAPGLRERIVATSVRSPADLEAGNANYVGGDIVAGANTPIQTLIRPRLALDPYSTGVPGLYICSAATPPGGGVHGMGGFNAAQSALRHLSQLS